MRLTLRTLLSWKDGMLDGDSARDLAGKVEASTAARSLVARIDEVASRPTLSAPAVDASGFAAAANTTAEYLDNVLPPEQLGEFERVCFASESQLAETAATHAILAEWSRQPTPALDAATRRRLLAAVRARAAETTDRDATESGAAAARRTESAVAAVMVGPARRATATRAPRTARAPASAWLLVASAVALLAALVGVLGWSLARRGRTTVAPRGEVALREPVPAVVADERAGPPPVEADRPTTAFDEAEEAAPVAATPASMDRAPAPEAAQRVGPQPGRGPATPAAAAPREEPADDAPPFGGDEPAEEPMQDTGQAAVVTTTEPPPAAPQPAAAPADRRVPQGDALAIAAPAIPAAALPAATQPAAGQAPRAEDAVATGGDVSVEGDSPLLHLPLADGSDAWLAGAAGARLALPVRVVAAPFCRPVIVVDALRIVLEPRTWAVLRRDDDGTPRLEIAFGGATVAGDGRLAVAAGGLAGTVTAGRGMPVGIEVRLERLPGAESEATLRVARIVPTAGRIAWQSTATVQDAPAAAAPPEIAAGQALEWRGDAPDEAVLRSAAVPPPWLAGRQPDDPVDRRLAEALIRRLAAGTAAVPALETLAADRRVEARVAAAAALALVGDYDDLARLLVADGRDAVPESLWIRLDEEGVQPALARGPKAADAAARAIAAQAPPGAAPLIVRLARGFTDEELADGGAADLVDALASPHLVVRRYAIANLVEIAGVSRAEQLHYRAEWSDEAMREKGIAWWRTQLDRGRVRRGAPR